MGFLFLWILYFFVRLLMWFVKLHKNEVKLRKKSSFHKIVNDVGSPFYGWDVTTMEQGVLVPWNEVVFCKTFSKKYLKKPEYLYEEIEVPEFIVTDMKQERHECINEDLLCVYYTGSAKCTSSNYFAEYSGEAINARIKDAIKIDYFLLVQGVLTICPVCKRQMGFNGTCLN